MNKKIKCELYNDSMQNWKSKPIQKAQLIIADVPYNVGMKGEPMDDVISRNALFREMEKAQWYNNADRDEIAEELVLNAPTIEPRCETCEAFNKTRLLIPQPQRKKGKWIIKDNPGTGWYRITCSECGEDVTSTAPCIGFYPNAKVMWDFCPNCGADMREPEDLPMEYFESGGR